MMKGGPFKMPSAAEAEAEKKKRVRALLMLTEPREPRPADDELLYPTRSPATTGSSRAQHAFARARARPRASREIHRRPRRGAGAFSAPTRRRSTRGSRQFLRLLVSLARTPRRSRLTSSRALFAPRSTQAAIKQVKELVETYIPADHLKSRACVVDVSEVRPPLRLSPLPWILPTTQSRDRSRRNLAPDRNGIGIRASRL